MRDRIFEFDPDGGIEAWTIHSFGNDEYAPGAQPSNGPLVQAANGSFFGTTVRGGDDGVGTLFRLDLLGPQRGVTTLFSFPAAAPYPTGGVILGSDGLLYGTVTGDGVSTWGAVFRIGPDGSGFTVLYTFSGAGDGAEPATGIIEGLDGLLYGTTNGGSAGGTLFRIGRDGTPFQVLRSRVGPGVSNLVQAPNGMLYGYSREAGSATSGGSVFSLRPSDGLFTTIHAFEVGDPGGTNPEGRLALGAGGRLYGFLGEDTASAQAYYGAIFRVAVDGAGYQAIHLFSQTDGMNPGAGLLVADDGTLWGTTARGGTNTTLDGDGVLFSLAGAAGVPVEMRDGGGTGTDTVTLAGADLQTTLWLRNFSGIDAGGPVTVRVGSPFLQFIQGWSDSTDWSCTASGSEGLCTWSGTLQSGQESAMLSVQFLTGSGPFTTGCVTSPTLGPCVYINAAIEDRGAAAGFPVFVTTRHPTTGAINKFPYAADDSAEVLGTAPVTIRVLDNDSDADGASLVLVGIETPPASGSATINPDSTITFTPSAPLVADDRFTYRIEDADGAWSVATVFLVPATGSTTVSLTIAPVPAGGSVSGGGLACGNGGTTCQVSFGGETTVTLTATPASGYVFTSWGGACAGTAATTSVLVDAAKSCSAVFTSTGGPVNGPPYTMTISPPPTGGRIQGAGINCGAGGSACSVTMPAPMTLGMSAVASAGYVFGGWTGDCSGTSPSLWVALNGPRTCGATFTPAGGGGTPTYALTIAPVPAGGSVSGNGLACGNGGTTCQVSFGGETTVTLTATPASGYVFTSWGGACAGTAATTSVLVDAAKSCSAVFTSTGGPVNGPPYTMTISPPPTGGRIQGAGINCGAGGSACSVTMPAPMTLGMSAVASAGYVFGGWTGDCSGTSPSLWVALNGPRTCGATFTPAGGGGTPTYALTIAPVPAGGSVSGNGLACGNGGTTCQVSFGGETNATLTATPASGYVFTSWGGSCSGTNATTSVLVSAAKSCSAVFTSTGGPVNGPPYTMTIFPVPAGGTVQGAGLHCSAGSSDRCTVSVNGSINLGMFVTPDTGYSFGGWTGDCMAAGTSSTLWITLAGPRTCSAIFTPR